MENKIKTFRNQKLSEKQKVENQEWSLNVLTKNYKEKRKTNLLKDMVKNQEVIITFYKNLFYNIWSFFYNWVLSISLLLLSVSVFFALKGGSISQKEINVKTQVINRYKPTVNGNTNFVLLLKNMENNKQFELNVTIGTWDQARTGEILFFNLSPKKSKMDIPKENKEKSEINYSKSLNFLLLGLPLFLLSCFRKRKDADYDEFYGSVIKKNYKKLF